MRVLSGPVLRAHTIQPVLGLKVGWDSAMATPVPGVVKPPPKICLPSGQRAVALLVVPVARLTAEEATYSQPDTPFAPAAPWGPAGA